MTEGEKTKLKSLISFHSASKIDYNGRSGERVGKKKEEKNKKESTEQEVKT